MPISYLRGVIGTTERSVALPKPDEIILQDVEKRNSLRSVFSPITVENLPDTLKMFRVLGIEINLEMQTQIEFCVQNEGILGAYDGSNMFLGVNSGDQFVLYGEHKLNRVQNLYIINSKIRNVQNMKDYLQYNTNRAFKCETLEIARELLTWIDKCGFKQEDGSKWIDENGKFAWTYGENTCYNILGGLTLDGEDTDGVRNTFAQLCLYDYNKSLHRFRIPEGGLTHEQLVRGRIYELMYTNSNTVNPNLMKFNGDIEGVHSFVDRYEDYCREAVRLNPANCREYFVPIRECHRERWRRGTLRWRAHMAEVEAANRVREEQERVLREYNDEHDIDTYNKDVRTQLMSESLHKVLIKALDNKVARRILRLNRLGYLEGSTRNVTIRRSDKLMTYTPSGKPTEMTEDGVWVAKGRQDGKYGKVIKKLLSEQDPDFKYKDHDIETLVNHLKACAADGDFQIVKGSAIRDWYNGDTYHEDEDVIGTLASSCMRDEQCSNWFDIYVTNDIVQMIILVKDGYLVGRALLWDNKWVDRIYGTDSTIKAFKNFCKEKGFHCKSSQNSDPYQGWINPDTGASYQEEVVLELNTEFESYPYADTFCHIDVAGGKLSNSTNSLNCYAEMRDTCGGLDGDDFVYDEYDDRTIHIDDSVYIRNHGYRTHYDNASECEVTGDYFLNDEMVEMHDGRYAHEDNVEFISTAEAYAEDSDTFHCEQTNQRYIQGYDGVEEIYLDDLSMAVASCNVEDAYHDNGYTYVDDEWRNTEDLIEEGYVEVNGEWSLSDEEAI